MTTKTLEADSGIFTLGMAVAPGKARVHRVKGYYADKFPFPSILPVTNWLYYDSIYTERYMSTPDTNAEGYASAAVNNITAFEHADFALAHGSGDDNVHFANTASLIDKLTQAKIRGWWFRMFTDADHSMSRGGDYREVFEWLSLFLEDKWFTKTLTTHKKGSSV